MMAPCQGRAHGCESQGHFKLGEENGRTLGEKTVGSAGNHITI